MVLLLNEESWPPKVPSVRGPFLTLWGQGRSLVGSFSWNLLANFWLNFAPSRVGRYFWRRLLSPLETKYGSNIIGLFGRLCYRGFPFCIFPRRQGIIFGDMRAKRPEQWGSLFCIGAFKAFSTLCDRNPSQTGLRQKRNLLVHVTKKPGVGEVGGWVGLQAS